MADRLPPHLKPKSTPPYILGAPGRRIWKLRNGRDHWTAELEDQGRRGVEVQILKNGRLLISRRFRDAKLARQWAAMKRRELAPEGDA